MASNTVEILVTVAERGLAGTVRTVSLLGDAGRMAGRGLAAVLKPLAALGAAGGAVQTIGALAGTLAQLAPAALLLPGALLAGAAAMATFKLATAGFAEAVSAADPAAFAQATKDMAPAAVETAQAFRDMKPAITDMKKEIQGRFFEDFAGIAQRLGSTYMPVLKGGLGGIATQMGQMGKVAAKALMTPQSVGAVNAVLSNTKGMLGNMKASLADAATGFLQLGSIGSDYLPRLGTAIGGVAEKFKSWVSDNPEKIRAMIDGAIAGFKDLFAVIGNVGSILGSIFTGLGGQMTSPLQTLRELTTALAEFFRSAEAQGPLQALGETLRVVGAVVGDVVLAAFRFLGPIIEALAPIVQTLAEVVGDILTTAFEKLGPPIAALIDRLGPVLGPALEVIGQIITDVVIPALAGFIDWLAGPGLTGIFQFALAVFMAFSNALDAVLTFVDGVLAGMQFVFRILSYLPGEFGANFGRAADAVANARDGVNKFRGAMDMIKSKIVELSAIVSGEASVRSLGRALASIPPKVTSYVQSVVSLVQSRAKASGGVGGGLALVGERGPELVRIPGMAAGGIARNMAMVGARGAELVGLPPGSTVIPNGQSERMMNAAAQAIAGGGQGGGVSVTFRGNLDGAFATAFMMLVRAGQIQIRAT